MFDSYNPARRENPPYTGDVDTTQMGGIYDVQHMHSDPHCGYKIPSPTPLPPVFPALTGAEQIRDLGQKVNELCGTLEGYNHKVEDAFEKIINSCICNDAYYKDVWSESGYIPESGSNYKVIHVPFLDRAHQPVYFELGLAYDNTTNAGVKEGCFSASQRFLADKLVPAQNKGDSFTGTVMWKGAPIYTQTGDSYTFAVTQSGFFKGYKNVVAETLKADKVRNSCGARGILVYNKELATDSFPEDASTMKARVAVGQNYDTKERFIIVVDGGDSVGCTSEQLGNLFVKYGCMVAIELASGTSVYGMDKGSMVFAPAVASEDDTPSVPESNAFWYITKRRHYHNEYVRDVSLLTQQMGEEIWRRVILNEQTDYAKQRIVELAKEIDQEIEDRKAEIARLETVCDRIESESKERDNELTELIATRVRESEERDAQLQVNIDNEAKTREENDKTLQNNIDKEAQTRETNDNSLHTKLQANIDSEANTRELNDIKKVAHVDDGNKRTYSIYRNNDTKIAEDIEVYEYNKLVADLQTLGEVAENLKAEVAARKAGDDALQAQITQEISDRNAEIVKVTAIVTQETADREVADTALGNRITNEVTTRESNVKELNERLDSYTETTDTVIKQIQDDLTQEVAYRGNADTAIRELINAEQTARENKDTELADSIKTLKTDYESFKTDTTADLTAKKTQIDSLIVDMTNVKTVIDTHTTQMSSINATITALQATISSMETSLENMKQSVSNMQTAWEEFKKDYDTYKTEINAIVEQLKADEEQFKSDVNTTVSDMKKTVENLDDKYIIKTGDTIANATFTYTKNNSDLVIDAEYIDFSSTDNEKSLNLSNGLIQIGEGTKNTLIQNGNITTSDGDENATARILNLANEYLSFGKDTNLTDDSLYPVYTKTPTEDNQAATKKYVDDAVGSSDKYVLRAGDTLTDATYVLNDSSDSSRQNTIDASGAILNYTISIPDVSVYMKSSTAYRAGGVKISDENGRSSSEIKSNTVSQMESTGLTVTFDSTTDTNEHYTSKLRSEQLYLEHRVGGTSFTTRYRAYYTPEYITVIDDTTNSSNHISFIKDYFAFFNSSVEDLTDNGLRPVYTHTPTEEMHAATKKYVDDATTGSEMTDSELTALTDLFS